MNHSLSQLIIQNGLPKSHHWTDTIINDRVTSGIVWENNEIERGEALLLYTQWATVHFASAWYEIGDNETTNQHATKRDIDILSALLQTSFTPPATIIDIHCGSGRHAIALAKQGFQVIGMEEVTLPLKEAQKNAQKEHVTATFVLSNATSQREYAQRADIVISMFNSLGYTFSKKDDQTQLDWSIKLLKPNGYFVLDIRAHEYQKKYYAIPVASENTIVINPHFTSTATISTTKFWKDNRLGAIEKITLDNNNFIVQQMTYGWNTYPIEELGEMLKNAGAKLIKVHEDYYSNPQNIGERIFILAKKL